MRRTKIVATVGPASCSEERLAQLVEAGVDAFRLNFSHGSQREHGDSIKRIRTVEEKAGRPVPVLQDLAGPKIRIGTFADGPVSLEAGQRFKFSTADIDGNAHEVSVNYSRLPEEVSRGDTVLLSDGALELRVLYSTDTEVICEVLVGGQLSSHKGINLPSGSVSLPVLTGKDESDLEYGLKHGVDCVAVSFVRTAHDILQERQAASRYGREVPIIAKIEKHEALGNIDEIMAVCDGVMVARGDLGVEMPIECIPRYQKRLLASANHGAIPAITATHMLRSMVESPRPTRAEVTDVANAVLDGSDAMMLSEETAVGKYPVQAVQMMSRVICATEKGFPFKSWTHRAGQDEELADEQAVAHSACHLAEETKAAAIVTCTLSGSTTRRVAKYKPQMPVIGLTPDRGVWRHLQMVWGVVPIRIDGFDAPEELEKMAVDKTLASGIVRPGQKIVLTAGIPLREKGTTNFLRLVVLPH